MVNTSPLQDAAKRAQISRILSEYEGRQVDGSDGFPDAMAELRKLLPDEDAVDSLARKRGEVIGRIRAIKNDITSLQADLIREQDPSRMQEIQASISELVVQINTIKDKSAQAEDIVRTITKDIQRLDTAKKNLTSAMIAVRRWKMLVQAHGELKKLIGTKQYRAMSNSLSAINGLSSALQPLTANPPVAQIFKEIQEVQAKVKEAVGKDLDDFFLNDPNRSLDKNIVKEACLAVDVLGQDFKAHIIERYANTELREYRRIFAPSSEAGHLDNTARRYSWFRRILKQHDEENAGLFPKGWQIERVLVAKFSEQTKIDLASILGKEKPSVATLLEAWQATLEWEEQIGKRFDLTFAEVISGLPVGQAGTPISTVFEGSMKAFVDAQDQALDDMLSAYRGARSRSSLEGFSTDGEAAVTVLPSSTELFYFYAQTLEQCGKYSNGQGMKDLAGVFKKWLKIYSEDVLIASMRKPDSRTSMDGRPNSQELKNACLTLNTADYCLMISSQLEEKVKDVIDDKFREDVSFQEERDLFFGVISACLLTILRELESACEPALAAILKTPWANVENVLGRSAYVVDLVGSIKSVAEVVRERVEQKKYIKSFADKAVGVIVTRYTAAVIKSRPLKKVGAEQILLDVQSIKNCLLDLPEQHTAKTANAFTRLVQKSVGQLETMLKVVLAPEDPPEGFVQNYCLLIGDKSFTNFQKILDLKGTPRTDQQKLLDIFLAVTSTNPELTDTSFMTSIDMDPDNKNAVPGVGKDGRITGLNAGLAAATAGRSETPKGFGDFKKLVSFALHGQMNL